MHLISCYVMAGVWSHESSYSFESDRLTQHIYLIPSRPSMTVQFSSARDGIYALGKALMRFTQSLRSFHSVAFETVPMFV